MITKIAHLADIHVPKSPKRHPEFKEVFEETYKSLRKQKPDRIVIVGDLFHDYIDLQPEATILAAEFLNKLSEIAPVIITRGNHDIRKKALKRIDSIEAVVRSINNSNVTYYNETGFFHDENVTWAVWKHGETNNSPWRKRKKNLIEGNTTIDLFHDPVFGSVSPTNYTFNNNTYKEEKHFKGDFSFFGDIHLMQRFHSNKAYCGSLIEQNFAEGDGKFHGYLLWDISTGEMLEIEIPNKYSHNNIIINQFTDYDDLEVELRNPTEYNRVKIIWRTLPEVRNNSNERKVISYLNANYNIISVAQKNEFIEEDEIETEDEIDIEVLTDKNVQHEIFRLYLSKIGVEEEEIDAVLKLDDEITSRLEIEDLTNIQWSLLKLKGENFMSYGNLELDWKDDDGLYQIVGLNTAGKTTIMKLITYVLYNKTLETENTVALGDYRYVNNRNGANFCEGSVVIEVNGEYYGIKRRTEILRKKTGEMKATPTTLDFYKLDNPDDKFTDDNNFNNLIEDERKYTQKVVDKAIGSYDNFMRVVMTTSDTLNKILSNKRAEFVDSLLFDSGLDIFDLKLKSYKEYQKEYLSKPRVSCNVENSKEKIKSLEEQLIEVNGKIDNITNNVIPVILERINKGEAYVETLTKKLHQIDTEIYFLNVDEVQSQIDVFTSNINTHNYRMERLKQGLTELAETYDQEEYNRLVAIKDSHREKEFDIKSKIKDIDNKIYANDRLVEQRNGSILLLMQEGKRYKDEIFSIKNDTNCPTCGQLWTEEHRQHANTKIKNIEENMFSVAESIKKHRQNIDKIKADNEYLSLEKKNHEQSIVNEALKMDTVLHQIGEFNDLINDVNKRKDIQIEIDKIPPQIEILELKIENLQKNIDLYNESLTKIEENRKIEFGIEKAKERLNDLKREEKDARDSEYNQKTIYGQIMSDINDMHQLIDAYLEQEKIDAIHDRYKKCIHRDGIPTQILTNHIIPRINNTLNKLLADVPFNVWLDKNLVLKLGYNTVESSIDAISASGKERTFAAVSLKFTLNLINAKSKPTLFLLDEVMGKLTEESVDEFIILIDAIKDRMKKILIVEHNHNINPDYIIKVDKTTEGISSLNIE